MVPNFLENPSSLDIILSTSPDVLNHNLETIPRLCPRVRPQADYHRSPDHLQRIRSPNASMLTKSGLMLGFGAIPLTLKATRPCHPLPAPRGIRRLQDTGREDGVLGGGIGALCPEFLQGCSNAPQCHGRVSVDNAPQDHYSICGIEIGKRILYFNYIPKIRFTSGGSRR